MNNQPETPNEINFLRPKYFLVLGLIAGTVTPALIVNGFAGKQQIPFEVGLMISVICGGLAGLFAHMDKIISLKGSVIGIVYGVSAFLITYFYTLFRTSIIKAELAIPLALGALPPAFVWYLIETFEKSRK